MATRQAGTPYQHLLTLDVEQYDCPFIATTDDHGVAFSAVHWEYDRTTEQLETRLVVEGDSPGALDDGLRTLRRHPNMHDCQLLARRSETAHIRTVIGQTDAMGAIRENDGYVTGPFHIEDGSERWHVGFDRELGAEEALASLDRNNEFEVLTRDRVELSELQDVVQNVGAATRLIEGCRELSEVERRTMTVAADEGYFQTPREATLGALAERFDVSKTAVSKNLRRGQQKVVARVVAALDDLDRSSG